MLRVETIRTDDLGDRSYVVHDGVTAVVVDPQRDTDRVEELLAERGVAVAMVVETHIHNDYVTGGHALAAAHDARYVVNAEDPVSFPRTAVSDGDELTAGTLTLRAVATPGHTATHLSWVVGDGTDTVVFTGGSLLHGSVGRTDLVDPDRTVELTHAQYRSARRLAATLADDTAVYPTHGFGSFCAAGGSGRDGGTIADERAENDALLCDDEDGFVARLVAGLTAYPAYYAHMAPRNLAGPGPADLGPLRDLEPRELARRVRAGEWVVDLRDRRAYAAAHLAGSVGIELGDQFSTWLGRLIVWGTPVTLIGATTDEVADAQRRLVRIGIDRPEGRAVGDMTDVAGDEETRGYPTVGFDDLAAAGAGAVVLDVRGEDEFDAEHIPGALNVPLQDLPDRLAELPAGRLWVHCESAYRASIAASLLDRAGHDVVLVADSFPHARELGLTDVREAA